jgi:hypothetical protein
VFKREKGKRNKDEESNEKRWLLKKELMIKKRESDVFIGKRLKEL